MGVGEKNCEEDSGTVFSTISLGEAKLIKEKLNISECLYEF